MFEPSSNLAAGMIHYFVNTWNQFAESYRLNSLWEMFLSAGPVLSIAEIEELFPFVDVSPKFPDSCPFVAENLQPQINIPYCQR